ncbi:MAG TPA: hypothetical protein VMT54_06570 [Candidatus Cybelea sp.]|nr:hypothetical protein [Candidatus Cybelea sp.]
MKPHFSQKRPVEYFILMEPRPDGPTIGTYGGQPIPAAIRDGFGRRFTYAGVASRLRNGKLDVESLSPGEWFVRSGLVYRIEPADAQGMLGRLFKPRHDAPESAEEAESSERDRHESGRRAA